MLKRVEAGDLIVAYEEEGPAKGWPVVLLHGFPYDVHAFSQVAQLLAAQGACVRTPYLRGFGPTRFRALDIPRSGQQAALGADVLAFLDALALPKAVLGGFDWGARAACVCAALHPERVAGLVSVGGYLIQELASANVPDAPENERRLWYQYYFHHERGRAALLKDRRGFCRLLWKLWSPSWAFDAATYERTCAAFDNPDFVEVAIHSYRHRFQLVAGDPRHEGDERALALRPTVRVPTITLDGADDGVLPTTGSAGHARYFSGRYQHRTISGVGHNLPQESPHALADAVLTVADSTSRW